MKITLDIDQLLGDGRISQDEYSRLRQFAAETTSSLALNIVLAFGIVAVVNLGFWIGSLWGDRRSETFHSDVWFIVGWAICILAAGIWGARANNRWLVNTAGTFGAIHLYRRDSSIFAQLPRA